MIKLFYGSYFLSTLFAIFQLFMMILSIAEGNFAVYSGLINLIFTVASLFLIMSIFFPRKLKAWLLLFFSTTLIILTVQDLTFGFYSFPTTSLGDSILISTTLLPGFGLPFLGLVSSIFMLRRHDSAEEKGD